MKIRVQINDQTYEVEIIDLQARPITAVVDGETFDVWPDEAVLPAAAAAPEVKAPAPVPARVAAPAPAPTPSPAPKPAAPAVSSADRSKIVVAPIPGTIISISVKEGQDVAYGQELFILEAMKMKSAIRANRAGKIAAILVAVGDRVSQNQSLLEYGD